MVQIEAGIARPDRDDTCYIADLAITCNPPPRAAKLLQEPVLIVEVLSPGTALYDRQVKVSDYRQIESVREILLIDSERVFAEILRREGDRWLTEIVRDRTAGLTLTSIGLEASMAELYEGIDISDAIVVPHPGSLPPT